MNERIAYHLRELEVARDSESPHFAPPDFSSTDQAILDIGCGIGQTLIAAELGQDKLLVGFDIDLECLAYGRSRFGHIEFINGTAERLPFADGSFDFVYSRVALPYTNIPQSLAEIARVLKCNGRVWFTMHSWSMTAGHWRDSVRKLGVKDMIYRSYVIVNSIFFHFFGKLLPFPVKKRYESFQTEAGMERCMKTIGFTDVSVKRASHFVCTARKAPSP